MKFWDASALVPLLVPETVSATVHQLRREDNNMAVWWATEVECVSAFWRRKRSNILDENTVRAAVHNLSRLLMGCEIVLPSELVRDRTLRLLALHPLGSADAFQLAAALILTQERPSGVGFVSLDDRLRDAARREGFYVLPG